MKPTFKTLLALCLCLGGLGKNKETPTKELTLEEKVIGKLSGNYEGSPSGLLNTPNN